MTLDAAGVLVEKELRSLQENNVGRGGVPHAVDRGTVKGHFDACSKTAVHRKKKVSAEKNDSQNVFRRCMPQVSQQQLLETESFPSTSSNRSVKRIQTLNSLRITNIRLR